jgi:nitrogen fixation protein NifU and related proteins
LCQHIEIKAKVSFFVQPSRYLLAQNETLEDALYFSMMTHNDKVLEHFQHPHNSGTLLDATAVVEVTNPVCGDVLRLSVRVQGNRILEAGFKVQGCTAAIAAGSVLTDLVTGSTLAEAHAINAQRISDALDGLPPATFHAAQLAAEALAALLQRIESSPPPSR